MNNLFNGYKQQTLEGGLSNTNAFKDTIERITYQDQINEKLENFQRAKSYNEFQMERAFQNMKMNEMINTNKNNPELVQFTQTYSHNYNQISTTKQQDSYDLIRSEHINPMSNFYPYNPPMFQNQIHPALLEFNKQLTNEKINDKTEVKEESNEENNKDDECLKNIVDVMEGQVDERHHKSEFLKFIKRLKSGEIKLNKAENNIEITNYNTEKVLESNNIPDEDAMNGMWNKLEENFKNLNFNYNYEEENPINYIKESLFLKDNPFLGINENESKDKLANKNLVDYSRDMLAQGKITDSRYALEAEVQKNSDNAEAWLSLGKIHTENDRDDMAMQCFLKALEADPFNAEALLSLGISCTNEFDEFDAMVYIRNWLKLHHIYNKYFDNKNPLLNYEVIQTEIVNERSDEDVYSKALRIEGLKRNFYQEMINLMENIALNEKNNGDTDLWIALGIAHFIPHQNQRAIECFRKAVEINPKDYNAWNKLGAILAHSKMNDEAIITYKKALELKPNYARCLANLGIAYFNVNNFRESMIAFLKAVSIFKDIPHVWNYMSSVVIAANNNEQYDLVLKRNLDELLLQYGLK